MKNHERLGLPDPEEMAQRILHGSPVRSQPTPEEFAAQTGLSLEEAEMVLSARAARDPNRPTHSGAKTRLNRAIEALLRAERKVGVKPYEESK